MNKAFGSHFKHFGRLLGKIYLFLTPSKTGGRVPSQQGALTTCNLTYRKFPSRRMSRHYWPVWVCSQGKIKDFRWGGGDGTTIRNWVGTEVSDKQHIAAILDIKSPQTPCIVYFPGTLSFQGHLISSKSHSQQKLACRTDIVRSSWLWSYLRYPEQSTIREGENRIKRHGTVNNSDLNIY